MAVKVLGLQTAKARERQLGSLDISQRSLISDLHSISQLFTAQGPRFDDADAKKSRCGGVSFSRGLSTSKHFSAAPRESPEASVGLLELFVLSVCFCLGVWSRVYAFRVDVQGYSRKAFLGIP